MTRLTSAVLCFLAGCASRAVRGGVSHRGRKDGRVGRTPGELQGKEGESDGLFACVGDHL